MGISLDVTGIRRFESSANYTTGKTAIIFDYTKNDDRVTTLKVILRSGTTEIGSSTVDVSSQGKGTTQQYSVSIDNQTSPVTLNVTETSVTVPAGETVSYSPPTGKSAIVRIGYAGLVGIDSKGRTWSDDVIVPEGESINIQNSSGSDVTVIVYEFSSSELTTRTFTLEIQELDSGGNVLYSYSTTITDYPPITISTVGEGSVIVKQIK